MCFRAFSSVVGILSVFCQRYETLLDDQRPVVVVAIVVVEVNRGSLVSLRFSLRNCVDWLGADDVVCAQKSIECQEFFEAASKLSMELESSPFS